MMPRRAALHVSDECRATYIVHMVYILYMTSCRMGNMTGQVKLCMGNKNYAHNRSGFPLQLIALNKII